MLKNIALATVVALASSQSFAADKFKMGVEGGLFITNLGAEDLAQSFANATGRTVTYMEEQTTPYFRIYGAYELTDKLNLEVGYFNTASLDSDYIFSGTTATASADAKISGWDFGARLHAMEDVYLNAGIHMSEVTATASVTISGTTSSVSATQDGTGAYFGGGYSFHDNLSVGFTRMSSLGGGSDLGANFIYVGWNL